MLDYYYSYRKKNEIKKLFNISKIVYNFLSPIISSIPRDRRGQEQVVTAINNILLHIAPKLNIDIHVIDSLVHFTDRNFVNNWKSTPEMISWLLVHEEVSSAFSDFICSLYNKTMNILHHVPKCGGTSLNIAIIENGHYFVTYPTQSFEIMIGTYGLLGLSQQVSAYHEDNLLRPIIFAGHFNLANFILAPHRHKTDIRGISLYNNPKKIISSALRFTIGNILTDDSIASCYCVDKGELGDLISSIKDQRYSSKNAIKKNIQTIINSSQFISEYFDPLAKYYLNSDISTAADLVSLLKNHPAILLSDGPQTNVTKQALNIDVILGYHNSSIISHSQLANIIGEDVLESLLFPLIGNSTIIYEKLNSLN